jgi:hypothetical protein
LNGAKPVATRLPSGREIRRPMRAVFSDYWNGLNVWNDWKEFTLP